MRDTFPASSANRVKSTIRTRTIRKYMDHRPRKQFGQHFLHDPGIIRRIVDSFDPRPGQRVVEIGPGRGALTGLLLARAGTLDVVEIDRDLAARLNGTAGLRVHQCDALRFDFAQLAMGERDLRIIGNLPYNISTPLLFHLLEQAGAIQDMLFMLQKEVVDRLSAVADSPAYGRLSVMVQYRCAVEKLFDIGPGAFTPPPKVDSSVVYLRPHRQAPVAVPDSAEFARLVSMAFANRRKTLRNNLKGWLDENAIQAAGVAPQARAETLSLAQFAALAAVAYRQGVA
jgi:16S rRNA (adenine1518-N6/adenine1519-N6)-dimethyltransferase